MRVRVAGVLEQNGTLLLVEHRKNARSYWLLPGGRVCAGEYASDALKRELVEELALHVRVREFLFVVETVSPDSVHLLQPTFRIETDQPGSMKLGNDRRVVGYQFFGRTGLKGLTIYPDIGDELDSILAGRLPCRYLYKQWID